MSEKTLETRSKYTVYLAGDSTVDGDTSGWGMQLTMFFTKDVQIINKAKSGRSTKSFLDEGRFQEILDEISMGDYLFIQFGHNDQKLDDPSRGTLPYEDFQENLKLFIESAREKGAFPILVTPVQRRQFGVDGKIVNTLGDYPQAMKDLSRSLKVPLIDLWEKSRCYFEALGSEETKSLFSWYDVENPVGEPDDTHFNSNGAKQIAKLVVEGIDELELPFRNYRIK